MLFEGVDGIKVYDPRDGTKKVSDNPALILGHIVTQVQSAIVGEGFWPRIGVWADYLDEEVKTLLAEEETDEPRQARPEEEV